MAEQNEGTPIKKNPALAAVISALFPGAGFFYIGNYLKGLAYIIIFAALVVLQVQASMYVSFATDIVVYGLLIAGFYIFQIVDSFNAARATRYVKSSGDPAKQGEELSLFGSVVVLILGVVFLLVNFDVISFRHVVKLWPVFLIALGIKFILDYYQQKGEEQ